jgi:hypothetical protein
MEICLDSFSLAEKDPLHLVKGKKIKDEDWGILSMWREEKNERISHLCNEKEKIVWRISPLWWVEEKLKNRLYGPCLEKYRLRERRSVWNFTLQRKKLVFS